MALGVWGALGGSGGAIGMVAGGVLTKYAGWEWIFFVNVPIAAAVLVARDPGSSARAAPSRRSADTTRSARSP